jgi:predicted flap endonuclease-1-like 5' DNA nuclease
MTATTTTEQTVTTPPPVIESPAKPVAPKPASKAVGRKSSLIPKALTKPMVKAPAKVVAKPAAKPAAEKQAKLKKPKLVRDSFTIPKAEYTVLDDLKQRAGKLGSPVKKSELIRAGIKALAAMSDTPFLAAMKAVPTIKTGRPTKAKSE